MEWTSLLGTALSADGAAAEDEAPRPSERRVPGVAALLSDIRWNEGHAVLDLGSATGSSLDVYQEFADRIRFADLLTDREGEAFAPALDRLVARPDPPYDLVFAWDALDRLRPRERSRFVEAMEEITTPDARLHLVVDATERRGERPRHRYGLLGVDQVRCEPAGWTKPERDPLLPAQVEDLLAPFEVIRGFTLRDGLREYVAARGAPAERSRSIPV